MAKSDVIFKVDARTASAVQGILKVLDAQKKTEGQFKKTTGAFKRQDKVMQKLGAGALKFGAGFLGAAGIAAGIRGVAGEIQKGIDLTVKFEGEISSLLNLGNNIKNAKIIKEGVIGTSSATGFTTDEVTRTKFDIGSGGATLTPELRKKISGEAIQFGLAENSDPAIFAKALLTGIKVSGKEFNNDPNLLQNIFFKTVEAGRLTNAELADRVGQFLGPFKDAGFSAKEALSLIPSATAVGLPFEQTATTLRNFPGIITTDLKEKFGIDTKGKSLNDILGIIGTQLTTDQRSKLFGRENLTIGNQIVAERNQQAVDLQNLKNIKASSDFVADKLSRRLLTDPQFEAARLFKSSKVSGENTLLQKQIAEGSFARSFVLRKRGAQEILPGGLGFLSTPLAVGSFAEENLNPFTVLKRIFGVPVPGAALQVGKDSIGSALQERGVQALAVEKMEIAATKLEAALLIARELLPKDVAERFRAGELDKINKNEGITTKALTNAATNLENKTPRNVHIQ